MKRISTFSERLIELRIQRDATLDDFSRTTGFPAQTLNRYERGERIPKIDVATSLSETLHVAPLWLLGYDVAQSSESSVPEDLDSTIVCLKPREQEKHVNEPLLSAQETTLILKYRLLDQRGQQAVDETLDREYSYVLKGQETDILSPKQA